jgi:hypothetical protein
MAKGSTTLVIDAPTLGTVAHDQISQADLWDTPPKASDTALTVLSKSLHDASSEILESERYDTGVLDALLNLKQLLRDEGLSIKLTSAKRREENFILDQGTVNTIQRVKKATPEPQAILVSGVLDTIEHSKKRFQLTLKKGETVRGKIDEELIKAEQMRKHWGQSVTIKGVLHYKASGRPRFLEAQMIDVSQRGDEIFETIAAPKSVAQIWAEAKSKISGRDVVAEIWGKWPGDESTEQILDMLRSSKG